MARALDLIDRAMALDPDSCAWHALAHGRKSRERLSFTAYPVEERARSAIWARKNRPSRDDATGLAVLATP